MKNINKKVCHAEKSLLSISRLLGRYRFTTTNSTKKGGPEQKRLRTTTCFNNGFTLIELLVVVLIIGILAAVAVPQYEKAVEKSKAAQALTLLKAIGQAAQSYYLSNGTWPKQFSELEVDIPWTGTDKWHNSDYAKEVKSNGEWSIQIYNNNTPSDFVIWMGRIAGSYAGAGFYFASSGRIGCIENSNSVSLHRFSKAAGSYCSKLFNATVRESDACSSAHICYYRLP